MDCMRIHTFHSLYGAWASPSVIKKAVGWMLTKHGPFRLYPKFDPAQWRWLWKMTMNCSGAAYERNLQRMQRLAVYSRDCFIYELSKPSATRAASFRQSPAPPAMSSPQPPPSTAGRSS